MNPAFPGGGPHVGSYHLKAVADADGEEEGTAEVKLDFSQADFLIEIAEVLKLNAALHIPTIVELPDGIDTDVGAEEHAELIAVAFRNRDRVAGNIRGLFPRQRALHKPEGYAAGKVRAQTFGDRKFDIGSQPQAPHIRFKTVALGNRGTGNRYGTGTVRHAADDKSGSVESALIRRARRRCPGRERIAIRQSRYGARK